MLENAVRICDAKFGNIYPLGRRAPAPRCDAQYAACVRRSTQAFTDLVQPGSRHGRMVTTKAVIHVADVAADPATLNAIRQRLTPSNLGVCGHFACSDAEGERTDRRCSPYTARKFVPSPTSRSSWSQNFAAQAVIAIENARLLKRRAAAYRDLPIAGAADGNLRRVARHFKFAGRYSASARNYWRASSETVRCGDQCRFHCRRRTYPSGLGPWHDAKLGWKRLGAHYPLRSTDETVMARAIRTRSVFMWPTC